MKTKKLPKKLKKTTKVQPKKHKFEISLPVIVTAEDYHDFRQYNDVFDELGIAVQCEEVGFDCKSARYVGIVHFKGTKLTDSLINSMIPYHIQTSQEE